MGLVSSRESFKSKDEVAAAPTAAAVAEAKAEVQKMSVRELKVYLGKHNVDSSRCVEKGDLLRLALAAAEKAPTAKAAPPRPQAKEFCSCWQFLLPERAPEWYINKIGGKSGTGGDCHDKPAPEGSLYAIGHVQLKVPDGPLARCFYETGLGFHASSRGASDEVRLNAGPSQVWLKVAPSEEADRWPGEIRVWVDNIQTTYDHMAGTDGQLGIKLVSDYGHGINGGEFSMKIIDPFLKTFYIMTEAPRGRKEAIQQIGCESSSMKANVLALSDLSIKCKTRSDMQMFGEFYKEFFGAAVTPLQYSCMVHFSPGRELHQTLSFVEDVSVPPATNLASFCFYMASLEAFGEAYAKCAAAGIVESPHSRELAEQGLEFVVTGMIDPNTKRMLMPMRNIVRCKGHLDCLVIA